MAALTLEASPIQPLTTLSPLSSLTSLSPLTSLSSLSTFSDEWATLNATELLVPIL
jgi:hypothetical protein